MSVEYLKQQITRLEEINLQLMKDREFVKKEIKKLKGQVIHVKKEFEEYKEEHKYDGWEPEEI